MNERALIYPFDSQASILFSRIAFQVGYISLSLARPNSCPFIAGNIPAAGAQGWKMSYRGKGKKMSYWGGENVILVKSSKTKVTVKPKIFHLDKNFRPK